MLPVANSGVLVDLGVLPSYLTEEELNALTLAFQEWYDNAERRFRKSRGRVFCVFLVMRFSGARIGEVVKIDDSCDIDWRRGEIRIQTLKKKKTAIRTVFVPDVVLTEISRYLAEWSEMRGRIFRVHPRHFWRCFKERAKEAGIKEGLDHPHILRHSRAVEMIKAGVPITLIQDLLGHSSLTITARYLKIFQGEARQILRERGLI